MSTIATDYQELPTMTFGDRLRRYRISRGLTLRQFADGTSISHATLGRIEHDGGDPADQHTRRAAKLIQLRYGVPADWLLYGSVPAQRKESAQVTHGYRSLPGNVLYHLAPVISLSDRRLARAA